MSEPPSRTLVGLACAFGAVLTASCTYVLIKHLVAGQPVMQLAALRSAFALVLGFPLIRAAGGWRALRMQRPLLHLARAVCAFVSIVCFFEAMRHLPLAAAVAIGLSAPLMMTALSVPVLNERVGAHRWSAIAVGFVGVLVITRPSGDGVGAWPALLMLISTFLFAAAMVLVRLISRTDSDVAMMGSNNLGIACFGGLLSLFDDRAVSLDAVGWVGLMAALMLLSQMLNFRAFRLAPVGVVAPVQYFEIVAAAIFGWVIWRETVAPQIWIGAAIIAASGLYVVHRERRRAA